MCAALVLLRPPSLLGEVRSAGNSAASLAALVAIVARLVAPILASEHALLHLDAGITVGVAVPGQVRAGVVVAASNLPYLVNADIGTALCQALSAPSSSGAKTRVFVFNDANCAIAAELLGSRRLGRVEVSPPSPTQLSFPHLSDRPLPCSPWELAWG